MKLNKLPLLFIVPMLLTSCGGSTPEKNYYFVDAPKSEKVTADILIRSHTKTLLYEPFTYSDKYFADATNKKLNVSLATAAFGVALIPSYPDKNTQALEKFGYTDIELGNTIAPEGKYDKVVYMVGHKEIDDRNMIVLSIRGSDYEDEWISNFNLGDAGDHAGFSYCADSLVDVLKNYLDRYELSDNPKIWLTGYSRGGAIANLLGKKVYEDPFFMMEEGDNDLYVNTFEAPQCAVVDNKEYPFIVNICNRNDIIIQNFKFDMIRRGINHYINDYTNLKEVEEFCLNLEKDKPLPTFFPKKLDIFSSSYIVDDFDSTMTYEDFMTMIMKMIYMDTSGVTPGEQEYLDVSTRSKYMEKMEFSLGHIVNIAINLTERNVELLKQYFTDNKTELLPYIAKILGGNIPSEDVYTLLKLVFDAGEISYTDDELVTISNQLPIAIYTMFAISAPDTLKYVATAIGNATYLEYQHRLPLIYSYLNSIK